MFTNMFTLWILSFLGLLNAYFLHWQYKREVKEGKKMFCFMGEDCSKVVGSKYGNHFGIKNEIYGIAYYISVFVFSILVQNFGPTRILSQIMLVAVSSATLFSFYLLYLQAKVIKTFCSWCLIAIFINIAIFVNFVIVSGLFK